MSPVIKEHTNLYSANFQANYFTRSLRLVKIMDLQMTMLRYNCSRVPNFWLSSWRAMQNCFIPSKVNCSFLTRIFTGFFMKHSVIYNISGGIVAEKRHTWISEGRFSKIQRTESMKPLCNIQSASSKTTIFKKSVLSAFFPIRSRTRPGVPTTTCIHPFFRAFISSLSSVPPIKHRTLIFKNSLKQKITLYICRASSRHGARIRA